jgi:hypothetical protein
VRLEASEARAGWWNDAFTRCGEGAPAEMAGRIEQQVLIGRKHAVLA